MITRLAPNIYINYSCHIGNLRLFLYTYLKCRKEKGKLLVRYDNIIMNNGILSPPIVPDNIIEENKAISNLNLLLKKVGIEFEESKKLSDIVIEATTNTTWSNNPCLVDAIFPVIENNNGEFKTWYKSLLALFYYGLYWDKKFGVDFVYRGRDLESRTTAEEQIKVLFPELKDYNRTVIHLPLLLDGNGEPMHKSLANAVYYEDLKKLGLSDLAIINYLFYSGMNYSSLKLNTIEELVELYDEDKLIKEDTMYNEEEIKKCFG